MENGHRLRLEYRKASDLPPNPRNWRTHPPSQVAALDEALARVGWAGALLYNERTGTLIDGHARRDLAGDAEVPVLVGEWDEGEEAFILATLDPMAALAEADRESLARLVDEVAASSGDAIRALLDGLGLPPAPELGPALTQAIAEGLALCVCGACGHEHASAGIPA